MMKLAELSVWIVIVVGLLVGMSAQPLLAQVEKSPQTIGDMEQYARYEEPLRDPQIDHEIARHSAIVDQDELAWYEEPLRDPQINNEIAKHAAMVNQDAMARFAEPLRDPQINNEIASQGVSVN